MKIVLTRLHWLANTEPLSCFDKLFFWLLDWIWINFFFNTFGDAHLILVLGKSIMWKYEFFNWFWSFDGMLIKSFDERHFSGYLFVCILLLIRFKFHMCALVYRHETCRS